MFSVLIYQNPHPVSRLSVSKLTKLMLFYFLIRFLMYIFNTFTELTVNPVDISMLIMVLIWPGFSKCKSRFRFEGAEKVGFKNDFLFT